MNQSPINAKYKILVKKKKKKSSLREKVEFNGFAILSKSGHVGFSSWLNFCILKPRRPSQSENTSQQASLTTHLKLPCQS